MTGKNGIHRDSTSPVHADADAMHRERWWEAGQAVRVAGVFEGGGAKGIAYVGALRAMRDSGAWFSAVAGASAGAITATLIAAGATPEEIQQQIPLAMNNLKTVRVAGLNRLARRAAYFDNSRLHAWLEAILIESVRGKPKPDEGDTPVTFDELYRHSGIELNIVAADLTMRQQIVFSHIDTPACQVADAVIAASAIPFAFESGALGMHCDTGRRHHLIVDGGVWSNYPMFVFADEAFRDYYHREHLDADISIGFVLHEDENLDRIQDVLKDRLQVASFDALGDAKPCYLQEHSIESPQTRSDDLPDQATGPVGIATLAAQVARGAALILVSLVVAVASLVPLLALLVAFLISVTYSRFLSAVAEMIREGIGALREAFDSSSAEKRRTLGPRGKRNAVYPGALETWYPKPQRPLLSGLAYYFTYYPLLIIQPLLFGLVVLGCVAFAVYTIFLIPLIRFAWNDRSLDSLLAGGFALSLGAMLLLMLILTMANHLLFLSTDRLAEPLARTYVAGASATPWEIHKGHVIRIHTKELAVTPPLTTLRFDLNDDEVGTIVDKAEQQARDQLELIWAKSGFREARARILAASPAGHGTVPTEGR